MLGPKYDSHSPETGIKTDWPLTGLKIVWSTRIGTGYGNGVAAAGRWFQFDRYGDKERLTCHNAESGEELWRWESPVNYRDPYGYNNGPRCSPVVDGNRVFVYGVTGTLACIHATTGEEIWKLNTTDEYTVYPNFFGVGASPLVFKDKLIVMVGGSTDPQSKASRPNINNLPSARPNQCGMIAFDVATGKEIYRTGNYLASYSAPVIAEVRGTPTCFALMREGLFEFDPETGGNQRFFPWRASIFESVNAASPLVTNNQILISETYEIGSAIVESNSSGLKEIWTDDSNRRNQVLRAHWSTPLFAKGFVYASSGRNEPDTDFRCFEWNGTTPPKVRWTHRNRDRSTGIIVDGHIVLLGERGLLQLVALNPEKYDPKAEFDMGVVAHPVDRQPLISPPSWAPPVLSHGLLYIRGDDRLVCLELIEQ